MTIQIENFSSKKHQAKLFIMDNGDIRVKITNFGCTIVSLEVKDRYGKTADVVLGFDTLEGYEHQDKYIGSLVGRCAGRIQEGWFNLNHKRYQLAANSGIHHLHGGIEGFDKKVFSARIEHDVLTLTYTSNDMEEGYPGTLQLQVRYEVKGTALHVSYDAVCDQDTLLNITNHSYFNLKGHDQGTAMDHELLLASHEMAHCDATSLPSLQRFCCVETPFDFQKFHSLKERIETKDEQLMLGQGYDHYYYFEKEEQQAILYEKTTGRKLIISTTMPGAQLYSANFLDGSDIGKNNTPYQRRCAVCIETQCLSNSIHGDAPNVVLRKNERYHHETVYAFTIE